ncbi:MAG TPA: sensor domain-containing protein [Thermoleophilia bacterium]
MNGSMLSWFFGVVARPRTWLNLLFQVLAFPLGLFYFIFLVTGLSVGLGLVIIWIGIPVLLVVAGAWWLFGAFERLQANQLLGAAVSAPPRSWETVNGVWGKLKAHFGSGSTWKDLLYLLAKLAFGVVSFTLLVTLAGILVWLIAFPIAYYGDFHLISWGNGQGWTPPLWLAILAIPGAILNVFLSLHIVNGWGWVCARWAELLLGQPAASVRAATVVPPAPLVATAPAAPLPTPVVPTPPAGLAAPHGPVPAVVPESAATHEALTPHQPESN